MLVIISNARVGCVCFFDLVGRVSKSDGSFFYSLTEFPSNSGIGKASQRRESLYCWHL